MESRNVRVQGSRWRFVNPCQASVASIFRDSDKGVPSSREGQHYNLIPPLSKYDDRRDEEAFRCDTEQHRARRARCTARTSHQVIEAQWWEVRSPHLT